MPQERVVAVGLLTQQNLDALGPTLSRVWPIDEAPCFSGLLEAIDHADRELHRERDAQGESIRAVRSTTVEGS